jgi:RNA polymerase sigma-70 factor (ECF subfamily)
MGMSRLLAHFRRGRLTVNARRHRFSERPLPADLVAAEECLNRMRCALDGVSGRTRAIFLMHRLDGLDYTEISQYLSLTVSAVEKHIASALAVLAEANDRG